MRLNFDTLYDFLCETCQVRRFGPRDKGAFYQRPLLYESGDEMAAGRLYVARDDMLPPQPPPEGVGLICAGERLPQVWGGLQVLCVAGGSGVLPLFNRVHEIFNRLEVWDEQLRDELERDEDFDLGHLMELGAGLLENPLSVVGRNLQPLFATESQPDGEGKFHLLSEPAATAISAHYAEEIRKVCRLERSITVPYLTSLPMADQQSYCNNLYPFGRFMGCVSISSIYRPFREGDFPLADHFFRYFQKAFFKYLRYVGQEEPAGAAALNRLLNQEPLSIRERALFQLPPGEYWYCFRLKEQPGEKAMPPDYMFGTLGALMSQNVLLTMHHGEIIGLLRDNGREVLEDMAEILSRMGYAGGMSSRFTDIRKLPDYFQQASYIVESLTSRPAPVLNFFQDYVLQYMLYECTGKLSVESLCSQGLLALLEHDRTRGTEYVKTLDTYLKNETSMSRTAEALYIHRSSLLKRLNKIRKILQEDLDSPDIRLYYRLCLALLERTNREAAQLAGHSAGN